MQYNEDHDDDNQNMNPAAGLREAWTYISPEEAEQPQDQENYDDSPQHEISPFECLCPDDDLGWPSG
jgi:hypothetical protein